MPMNYIYQHATIGGTFDHLHLGHKHFIDETFSKAKQVTIGITTEDLLKNKTNGNTIEDFNTRKENLIEYLKQKKYLDRAHIIPIDTIYGTTLQDRSIDAIFVTNKTLANALHINKKREEIHFPQIQIVTVPFSTSSDGSAISSERIRAGEIDRNGNSYLQIFKNRKQFILPQNLRQTLRIPIGDILQKPKPFELLITVGDVVTATFIQANIIPNISIIDFKTKRETISDQQVLKYLPKPTSTVHNPSGTIDQEAVVAFQKALQSKQPIAIGVTGEEDLLTLPAILLAPLGSVVVYGQSDVGMIQVLVTEEKKQEVIGLLKDFK